MRLWVEIHKSYNPAFLALVSLLVRLWVEISGFPSGLKGGVRSASLWGCELKCSKKYLSIHILRQPPCEAVSWNIAIVSIFSIDTVSLLVRLWVEINNLIKQLVPSLVSLLVRLWVEIAIPALSCSARNVSLLVRLWVEISYFYLIILRKLGQPPCEAVSWNNFYISIRIALVTSASLWGCELKCIELVNTCGCFRSASLWGCELKCISS